MWALVKMYLCWVNSRFGTWCETCRSGRSDLWRGAPLSQQLDSLHSWTRVPFLQLFQSAFNGAWLCVIPFLLDTAPPGPPHFRGSFSSHFSCATLQQTEGGLAATRQYVWGYRAAHLRISGPWLIAENMVWPQPVKVKPTRAGDGLFNSVTFTHADRIFVILILKRGAVGGLQKWFIQMYFSPPLTHWIETYYLK